MLSKLAYDERLLALEHRAAAKAHKTTAVLLFVSTIGFTVLLDDYRAAAVFMLIYAGGSIPYVFILERGGHGRWYRQEIGATALRRRRAQLALAFGGILGGFVYFACWYWLYGDSLDAALGQTIVWMLLWSGVQYWLVFRGRKPSPETADAAGAGEDAYDNRAADK